MEASLSPFLRKIDEALVHEFFMGRVSNKILHLANDMAVWIVD